MTNLRTKWPCIVCSSMRPVLLMLVKPSHSAPRNEWLIRICKVEIKQWNQLNYRVNETYKLGCICHCFHSLCTQKQLAQTAVLLWGNHGAFLSPRKISGKVNPWMVRLFCASSFLFTGNRWLPSSAFILIYTLLVTWKFLVSNGSFVRTVNVVDVDSFNPLSCSMFNTSAASSLRLHQSIVWAKVPQKEVSK